MEFTALFASSVGIRAGDLGYGAPVKWDIDPTEGYNFSLLKKAHVNSEGGGFLTLRDWDVTSQVRRRRFDVLWLHGYNSLTHVLAVLAQRSTGGAVLVREDQTLLNPRALWKQMIKQAAIPVLFRRSLGLYVGTENKRWFEHYGFKPERLFFVPHSVDNERLQVALRSVSGESEKLRRRFGVSERAGPVILSVMKLIPKKQPFELLEAFRRLRSRTRCVLLIVGSGDLEADLRNTVNEQGIPDVMFAGFLNQSEIHQAYGAADIFTLFSGSDTWGLVVNEAMNFRLPVVISDKVGCGPDLVDSGRNGFVVPFTDPARLAEVLQTLVESRELRESYGAISAEMIQGWNYERAAQGLLDAAALAVGPERAAVLRAATPEPSPRGSAVE